MDTTLSTTAGRTTECKEKRGPVTRMPKHHVTADDSQFVSESTGFERCTPLQAAAELMVLIRRGCTYLVSMDTLHSIMHVPPIMYPLCRLFSTEK